MTDWKSSELTASGQDSSQKVKTLNRSDLIAGSDRKLYPERVKQLAFDRLESLLSLVGGGGDDDDDDGITELSRNNWTSMIQDVEIPGLRSVSWILSDESSSAELETFDGQDDYDVWLSLSQQIPKSNCLNGDDDQRLMISWDDFNHDPIHPTCSDKIFRLAFHDYLRVYPTECPDSVYDSLLDNPESEDVESKFTTIDRQAFLDRSLKKLIGLSRETEDDQTTRIQSLTHKITQSIQSKTVRPLVENFCYLQEFFKRDDNHLPAGLKSGLEILVGWIRVEVSDRFEDVTTNNNFELMRDDDEDKHFETLSPRLAGLVSIWLSLEQTDQLVEGLTGLVRSIPLPGDPTSSHSKIQSLVYNHLEKCLQSRSSSNLLAACLSWLLDRVSARVLLGWQTWLGVHESDGGDPSQTWSVEKDEIFQSLWYQCGIQRLEDFKSDEATYRSNFDQALPALPFKRSWAYNFDPSYLPSFIPPELGMSLFEAGLALRILRSSSHINSNHPLCLSFLPAKGGRPGWVWTADILERAHQALEKQSLDFKLSTSAWRNGIRLLPSPSALTGTSLCRSISEHRESNLSDTERILDVINTIPEFFATLDDLPNAPFRSKTIESLVHDLEGKLRSCKNRELGILEAVEVPSLDLLTDLTIWRPLISRSKDINSCLLSFFLIEMNLPDHFAIMSNFMFFFEASFSQSLSVALFDQPEDSGELPLIGVSDRLMRRGTWPPGGFDLAFALRTVVLDSVARLAQFKDSTAWDDLEDRLSFTISTQTEDDESNPYPEAYEPESINGFDFLWLDFKPPDGVRSIFSQELLHQYQLINQYLMKLLRLQSIMRTNWKKIRPDRSRPWKLRRRRRRKINLIKHQYYHELDLLASSTQRLLDGFVSYAWEIAIGTNYKQMILEIEEIRESVIQRESWKEGGDPSDLNEGKNPETIHSNQIRSIEGLISRHRSTLREIMTCLFLRDRQKSFAKMINQTIFRVIIELSIHLKDQTPNALKEYNDDEDKEEGSRGDEDEQKWKERIFKIKSLRSEQTFGIKKLVKSLNSLNFRAVDQQIHHQNFENGFLKELLIRLDWNEFYFDY
ncbi:Spc98 family-domain-containing protein [Phakopsora pachyrhizi]|nr:Spc98 family-domain-containing protein [Phakopsora pachyrhizi]